MAHLDRDFPMNVAAGARAMRRRRSDIVELASGHEERAQRWQHSRLSFSAGLGVRSSDDLAAVLDLWEEAAGPVHSFRFRNWSDWRSGLPSAPVTPLDQPLGVGDGVRVAFQVVKRYGTALPVDRPVQLPHAGTFRLAINGVEALSGWSLSVTGGTVTFAAPPAAGAVLRCGFTYDVPVRFADDMVSAEWLFFEPGGPGLEAAPDISLVEVRL